MDNSVKLFCLGHSDDTKRAFPLKDTTIGELKELIKAKKLMHFHTLMQINLHSGKQIFP